MFFFKFDLKSESNFTIILSPKLKYTGVSDLGKGVLMPFNAPGVNLFIGMYIQPYLVLDVSTSAGLNFGLNLTEKNTFSVEKVANVLPVVKQETGSWSMAPSIDMSSKISLEGVAGIGLRVDFRLFGRSDMSIGVGPEIGIKASGDIGLYLIEENNVADSSYELLKDYSASVGGVARVSAYADPSIAGNKKWYKSLAEVEFNKYTWYLLPSFTDALYARKNGMVQAQATVGRNLFFETKVGILSRKGNKSNYGEGYSYKTENAFKNNPIQEEFVDKSGTEYWTYTEIANDKLKAVKLKEDEDPIRDLLIKFYHDTGGDNWYWNYNWCTDAPIEEWYGIDYDSNSGKYSLKLRSNNLVGAGSLAGWTSLEELDCWYNQLTNLDVSGCTALEDLGCPWNQLMSLDVSGCTALMELFCTCNQLTSLDVSGCTALVELHCGSNQLTSLDVSGFTALERLECQSNQLTSLNVSGCTALKYLYCESNQLTSLDASGCTALRNLWCHGNKINQVITDIYDRIGGGFWYDQRYTYYWTDEYGRVHYTDNGYGWWYPGEPQKGYHGK